MIIEKIVNFYEFLALISPTEFKCKCAILGIVDISTSQLFVRHQITDFSSKEVLFDLGAWGSSLLHSLRC